MFDTSKIKRFELMDLLDRTLTIKKLASDEDWYVIVAIDIKTGECFVLTCQPTHTNKQN